jgi:hypothetical protein
MEHVLAQLLAIGCSPAETGDAALGLVERDRCAPEDFYSTSNHHTSVRVNGEFVEVRNQRMDAMIVVTNVVTNVAMGRDTAAPEATCRRLRDLKAGDMVVTGMRGIRVTPEAKERDRPPPRGRSKRRFGRRPRWRDKRRNWEKPLWP